jgi:4-amino-4-deoxy-L-arabinose transferase-like glycosyltransferase
VGTELNTRAVNRPYLYLRRLQSSSHWLAVIFFVAILLRVAAALLLGDRVIDLPGTFDQISYDMLAQRVLGGHGFTVDTLWWPVTPAGEPTAHWSYLYTLYLTGVYGLFGHHPLAARLIQAIVAGILTPWLVYRLGRRHFGLKVGLVSAGLSALYLYFIYYAAALMTETFYIIVVLWTLDLAGQLGQASDAASNPRRTGKWLSLGLALGLTVLFRQVFLLFIPLLLAWLLWRSHRYQMHAIKQTLGGIALAVVILVLCILPWTLRNYRAFGSFVLLNTNAGFAFFWGNHPIHGSNFISILPEEGPSYQDLIPPELLDLNEAELDRALFARGLGFVQAEPGRYIVLSLSRIKDYFKFWPSSESGLISNLSRVLSFAILAPFMIYGLASSLRRSLSSEASILYIFVGVYTAIHLFTWALIRYRLPVDAVLLVFAGAAVMALQARLARYWGSTRNRGKSAPLQSGD